MKAPLLVGRSAEVRRIGGLLDAAAEGHGASLVVSGDAGIGKSALLAEAAREAAARGMRVLRAQGVHPEAGLPFAGLHQVVAPVLPEIGRLLPAQRQALLGAFGMCEVAGAAQFRVSLATLELLTECAADAPLAVIVDDGQWLDPSSASALSFVGRRLETDPVVPLAGHLAGTAGSLDGQGLPVLRLDGLDAAAAATLLGCARAWTPVGHSRSGARPGGGQPAPQAAPRGPEPRRAHCLAEIPGSISRGSR